MNFKMLAREGMLFLKILQYQENPPKCSHSDFATGAKQSQGPKGELLEGWMNVEESRKITMELRQAKTCCRGHAEDKWIARIVTWWYKWETPEKSDGSRIRSLNFVERIQKLWLDAQTLAKRVK